MPSTCCHSRSIGAIVALGILLMAIFLVWLAVAQAIYVAYFGYAAPSIASSSSDVLTTPAGWSLIIVGTGVGFLFAVVVLTISVVSFPLLLDRDVGAAGALLTSVRAVAANPVTMALWGLIVAGLLVIGSLPLLPRPHRGHAGARPFDLASLSASRWSPIRPRKRLSVRSARAIVPPRISRPPCSRRANSATPTADLSSMERCRCWNNAGIFWHETGRHSVCQNVTNAYHGPGVEAGLLASWERMQT